MSKADKLFVDMCQKIIDSGMSSEGQIVRPRWEDGTPAHTIKTFGVVNRYNLQDEFPALTLRPTAIKSAFDEILWIWQRKSNNVHDLNSHIWDEWADDTGSIGKAYGAQLREQYAHHRYAKEEDLSLYPSATIKTVDEGTFVMMDQVDGVLYDLRNTPFSRRIMTNIYNFHELYQMALYPCAYSMTFNVTQNKNGKFVLNGILNQRSQDILAANNWNVVQYSLLLMMFAQSCDMLPGELLHVISDAHIYDRHIPIVKELIKREQFPAPKVTLNPDIKDFYKFTVNDLIIEDYKKNPQIKNIPIAV